MPASQITFSTLVRSKSAWLVFLFVVYSIFGWFVVPGIVDSAIKDNLKTLAKWDTEIDSITFNPYALSLELEGTEINDSAGKVVAFDRFYVNFELLRSISGEISFAEVALEEPFINVSLDKEGVTNFQAAFASEESEPEEEASTEEESEPVKLFFGLIRIDEGDIKFSDFSQNEPFELELKPVSLALNEFATHNNDDGEYSLAISLGDGQTLDWRGQIGIAPFTSKGKLTLTNIQASTFWHYAKDASPYWLKQAGISLSGNYDTSFIEEEFNLSISDSALTVNKVELSPAENEDSFFMLEEVNVAPINFDLGKSDLSLGNITINQPLVRVIQNNEGELNLTKNLPESSEETSDETPETVAEETSETAEASKPFLWKLDGIKLNNGGITWVDDSLEEPAVIKLEELNIALGSISHDLSKQFPYDVAFKFAEAPHSVKGNVVAAPLKVDGELSIDKLALATFQPYISEFTHIGMDSGSISLSGAYDIQHGEAIAGTFDGLFRIDQLGLGARGDALVITESNEGGTNQFAGWNALVIEPIKLNLDPMSLTIGSIQLDQPFAKALIDADGGMNLASLVKSNAAEEDESVPEEETNASAAPENDTETQTAEAEASNEVPDINIGEVRMNGGRFDFADLSQKPQFGTYISDFGGSIKGLSSDLEAKSDVDLKGKLEDFGALAIAGTLNPLSEKPNTNLAIDVNNIDLSIVSTYSSRYMGYPIEKGKLNLDLDYDIQGSLLDAKNHVIVDSLNLGSSVDSPDSLGLPLPLALGLLKDTKGVIDINLPVSGDLNDPSFSAGGVIVTAFTNLITKAITAPFSLLGSIVEGGDKLSSVNFEPGSSQLSDSELEKLSKLADALQARPSLLLEIRGQADASSDLKALQSQKILSSVGAGTELEVVNKLESRMRAESLEAPLAELKTRYPGELSGLNAEQLNSYKGELLSALSPKVKVENVELITLAKARSTLLTERLVKGQNIPASRVFALEPSIAESKGDSGKVEALFNLTVR